MTEAELEKLSDAELDALLAARQKQAKPDYDSMTDAELDAELEKRQAGLSGVPTEPEVYGPPSSLRKKGFIEEYVAPVGKVIDSYTGAPTRAGLMATLGSAKAGEAPFAGIEKGLAAFGSQFGRDTEKAPTGKQIAQQAGVPNTALSEKIPSFYSPTGEGVKLQKGGLLDPTASGAVGLGIDIGADPMNFVGGPIIKGTMKGAEAMLKGAGSVAKAVKPPLTKGVSKVGSAMTGLPAEVIERYATKNKAIRGNIAKVGEDFGSEAERVIGQNLSDVRAARSALSKKIGEALDSLSKDRTIDISDLASKASGNEEIQGLLKRYSATTDSVSGAPKTLVNPKELNSIKQGLQDIAQSSYQKDGRIFAGGDEVSRLAKSLGAEAREKLNAVAPAVAEANKQLERLHKYESTGMRGLLKEGSSDATILSAGSQPSSRAAFSAKKLEELTGKPITERAKDYAATKRMANAGYLSEDTTGKGVERFSKAKGLVAGGLGVAAGHPALGAVGAALTSPVLWKKAIDGGVITSEMISKLGGTAEKAFQKAQTPAGQKILQSLIIGVRTAEPIIKQGMVSQ